MALTIRHTLWVFNAGVRSFRRTTIPEAINLLNALFLSNCVGNVGANFTIASAMGTQAPGAPISPGPFDTVVFLVEDVANSVIANRAGPLPARVLNRATTLGYTVIGQTGGPLSEVYWSRLFNTNEAAGAIFHEAAHAKSGMGDSMHDVKVGGPHGGPGLKVLSAVGGKFPIPSWDDLEFYQNQIPKTITVRTGP